MNLTRVLITSLVVLVKTNCQTVAEDDTFLTPNESLTATEAITTEVPTTQLLVTEDSPAANESLAAEVPTTQLPATDENQPTRGYFGGFYSPGNATNYVHYIHGRPRIPDRDYYEEYQHKSNDTSALGYYLGLAISQMTDTDFLYDDARHFYHNDDRNVTDMEWIYLDAIWGCHPNATGLCPENTENVCLNNGTIFCVSRIDFTFPCLDTDCVNTTVPCFTGGGCENYLESVTMPCMFTVTLVDIFEEKGATINRVGNSYILVPALTEEEKTYCATIVVEPYETPLKSP